MNLLLYSMLDEPCTHAVQLQAGDVLALQDAAVRVVVLEAPRTPGCVRYGDRCLDRSAPQPCGRPVTKGLRLVPGERYADWRSGLVVRCVCGGSRDITFDERPLTQLPGHQTRRLA